jgi:hypothetical protein
VRRGRMETIMDSFLLGVVCTAAVLVTGSMLVFGQQILELIDGD